MAFLPGVKRWLPHLIQFVARFCIGLAFLNASISVEHTGSGVYIANDILLFHRAAVGLFLRSR
jgi:hypothetical protein